MHENKINESKDTPRYQLLALGFPTYYFFQPGFIGPVLRVEISQEVAHNDTCLSLGQEHN